MGSKQSVDGHYSSTIAEVQVNVRMSLNFPVRATA